MTTKYLILVLLFMYTAFFWGIRNLFKRPLADRISLVAMFIPIIAIFSLRSYNDTVIDIANYSFILCGFMLYFAVGSAVIFFMSLVYKNLNRRLFLTVCSIVTVAVLIYGYIHAITPRVHEFNIELDTTHEMRICFISDMHIGRINSADGLKKLPNLINQQNPDLVIFGGDLIDPPAFTRYRAQLKDSIHKIKAPYGVYAVFGSHEGYCGLGLAENLYRECGINLLTDDIASFDGFSLVGCRDFFDPKRKDLSAILEKASRYKPVIVIDHNPKSFEESAALNVDLQLSGHTHAGQLWPFNILTNIIFKVPTGVIFKQSKTTCYITPGIGFWGCPFRIGNTPEIVIVNLKKRSKEK